jgi:hypothetical protein
MDAVLRFGRLESWEAEAKGLAVLWRLDVPFGKQQETLLEGLAGRTVHVRARKTVIKVLYD